MDSELNADYIRSKNKNAPLVLGKSWKNYLVIYILLLYKNLFSYLYIIII